MLVEQAIFTSAQTARGDGYHLVASSPGISESDSRELAAWGPSHDSLWETGAAAISVNFHRLPSGAFCVSQTTPAGDEYSQRRGAQVYTQSLVVSPAVLASFANNPFALLQAAIAQGVMCLHQKTPKRLESVEIPAESIRSNEDLLATWCEGSGPVWLPALIQSALSNESVGIVAGDLGPRLIAALVNCLPVGCRSELSFSTGLRFSLRRPYRLICLPDAPLDNRRLQRQHQLALLDLDSLQADASIVQTNWAALVAQVLRTRNTAGFLAELSQLKPIEMWRHLPEAAEYLHLRLGQRTQSENRSSADVEPQSQEQADSKPVQPCEHVDSADLTVACRFGGFDAWQRSDGSHNSAQIAGSAVIADVFSRETEVLKDQFEITEEPAIALSQYCPQAQASLRRLEDTVFEVFAGKGEALEELKVLWSDLLSQMGRRFADAAREHYLRYALAIWRQFTSGDDTGDPERAANAMEAICLLFDQ